MWLLLAVEAGAAEPGDGRVHARMEEARDRREALFRERARALLARADAQLRGELVKLDEAAAERRFAYRDLRGKIAQWWATSLLVPASAPPAAGLAVPTPDEHAYVEWMTLYAENTLTLSAEIRAWAKGHDSAPWARWSGYTSLPVEDQQQANELLGVGWESTGRFDNTTHVYAEELVNTVCLGQWRHLYIWRQGVSASPTLLALEPALAGRVLDELERATDDALGPLWLKEDPARVRPLRALELHGLHGDCLVALGRRDDALRRWQRGLERFPTAYGYEAIEARIRSHAP